MAATTGLSDARRALGVQRGYDAAEWQKASGEVELRLIHCENHLLSLELLKL